MDVLYRFQPLSRYEISYKESAEPSLIHERIFHCHLLVRHHCFLFHDQGNLLRGIDNCWGVARSVVTSQLEGPGQSNNISLFQLKNIKEVYKKPFCFLINSVLLRREHM